MKNKDQLMQIFTEEAIYNILGHIRKCWDYTYPTGKALEEAIYRGLKPFYSDVRDLGSTKTIVDIAIGKIAADIKGSKKLGHLKRFSKRSNFDENFFQKVDVPGHGSVRVRISKKVNTMVRRPKVNLQNYQGDANTILNAQILDYINFAFTTTDKDGCTDLYTVICQYGQDKGFKSIFLNIEKFSDLSIERTDIGTKKDGTPASYNGYIGSDLIYSLSSFNRGSSNLNKTFYISSGILYTWPDQKTNSAIYTREDLETDGAISKIE